MFIVHFQWFLSSPTFSSFHKLESLGQHYSNKIVTQNQQENIQLFTGSKYDENETGDLT